MVTTFSAANFWRVVKRLWGSGDFPLTESSDELGIEDSIVKRRSKAVETGSSSTIRNCGSGATFGKFGCWADNPPDDARGTFTGGEKGNEIGDFVFSSKRVLITVDLELPQNFFVILLRFCSYVSSKFFNDTRIVVFEQRLDFGCKHMSRCIEELLEI